MIKVNKNNIWHILHVVLLLAFYLPFACAKNAAGGFAVLKAFSFVGIISLLLASKCKMLSPYMFIMLFSYMYNCGEIWLITMGIKMPLSSFSIKYFSQESVNKGLFFVLLFLALIQMFSSFGYQTKGSISEEHEGKRTAEDYEKTRLKNIAKILFVPVLILSLVYDYNQFSTAILRGYRAALSVRRMSSLLSFANCTMPLLIFILLETAEDHKNKMAVSVYCVIRYTLYLFIVGTRLLPLTVFFCLLIIWFRNKTIGVKAKLWLVILMIIILISSSYVAVVRNEGSTSSSAFSYFKIFNPFLLIVQELGGTFVDMPLVIDNIGSIGYAYGKTYLFMGLGLIPKISIIIPNILKYGSISSILNGYFFKGGGLAGSIFAELYYNFGMFSLLLSPVLAKIYTKITKNFFSSSVAKRCFSSFMFLIFAQYVRGTASDVTDFFRVIFYFYIVYCFVSVPKAKKGHGINA